MQHIQLNLGSAIKKGVGSLNTNDAIREIRKMVDDVIGQVIDDDERQNHLENKNDIVGKMIKNYLASKTIDDGTINTYLEARISSLRSEKEGNRLEEAAVRFMHNGAQIGRTATGRDLEWRVLTGGKAAADALIQAALGDASENNAIEALNELIENGTKDDDGNNNEDGQKDFDQLYEEIRALKAELRIFNKQRAKGSVDQMQGKKLNQDLQNKKARRDQIAKQLRALRAERNQYKGDYVQLMENYAAWYNTYNGTIPNIDTHYSVPVDAYHAAEKKLCLAGGGSKFSSDGVLKGPAETRVTDLIRACVVYGYEPILIFNRKTVSVEEINRLKKKYPTCTIQLL